MMKYLSLIIVLLMVFVAIATADQAWLSPPTDDTFVVDYNPDDNYGSWEIMFIGYSNGWMDSFVEFDLTGYYGMVVDSAYLWLYVHNYSGTLPPNDCWIVRITTDWDESTLKWNNFPGWTDQRYITGPSSVDDWWVIDITDFATNWINGTYTNYGIALGTHDGVGNDWFTVRTKENTAFNYPKLELNYHDSTIHSTSLGKIKSLFE
jgi:hypothetical protein